MAYKSLRHFVSRLESAGELIRIKEFVSPRLEITEITDRFSKNNGKALLFENTGTQFPLLINALGSDRRICLAFDIESLDDIGKKIGKMVRDFSSPRSRFIDKLNLLPSLKEVASWMPRTVKGRGACQEVVMDIPDLSKLPVLTCWPYDGGPFITLPGVHTKNPDSGLRNLGMYRMQVFTPDMTGMHWHLHKGSAGHFDKYKALRRRMPISVTLGGDPAYIYAATAPLPENIDEYLLAGFLRKKRVELVRCLTNDIEVPADVDFVIEGYVDPQEELILEGPFGDHTGFYSLADYFPRFHVTCITHRKDAIYPATIVGTPPQEDGWIGKATEKIFLEPIKLSVAPEVVDMHMPVEGVFHNIVLVKIAKKYPGQALKVMNALWGAGQMMFNKILAVLDDDIELTDYKSVADAMVRNIDPSSDIHFMKGPVDILDHSSSRYAFGSKMGLDATRKLEQENQPLKTGSTAFVDHVGILASFPEGVRIVENPAGLDLPMIIIGIEKKKKGFTAEVIRKIEEKSLIRDIPFVLFLDDAASLLDMPSIVWIAANNIDPLRDCTIVNHDGNGRNVVFIDATSKQALYDDFERNWPNVIVMDDQIIQSIDQRWGDLGLGPFLSSPSIKYKSLISNQGPILK